MFCKTTKQTKGNLKIFHSESGYIYKSFFQIRPHNNFAQGSKYGITVLGAGDRYFTSHVHCEGHNVSGVRLYNKPFFYFCLKAKVSCRGCNLHDEFSKLNEMQLIRKGFVDKAYGNRVEILASAV